MENDETFFGGRKGHGKALAKCLLRHCSGIIPHCVDDGELRFQAFRDSVTVVVVYCAATAAL
jgi:hypothetical protein